MVDTTRPVLVWEPRRVVPSYAVPVEDLAGELVVSDGPVTTEHPVDLGEEVRGVLDPRTPFAVHTYPGTAYTLRTATGDLPGAAFAPRTPTWPGTWSWTGTPSTSGGRRTRSFSPTPTTRPTGSTA